jgi:hypothetical protein
MAVKNTIKPEMVIPGKKGENERKGEGKSKHTNRV